MMRTLTPRQRELLRAICLSRQPNGVAHGLFGVAIAVAGQDYHPAHVRLSRLEQMGLVHVLRPGVGRKLIMSIIEEALMAQHTFIALDPGFGNTKVCTGGKVAVVQSAVARPVEVGMAASGMRLAEDHARRIQFDGFEFIVGAGAWRWGQAIGSMDYAGLIGPERLALMYAAIADATRPGDLGDIFLIIGLPVPLMQDTAQMEPVIEALKRLKREHEFISSNRKWRFNITGAKAVAQPLGAYMNWLYNDALEVREGGARAEVAVLDLGMNTLDLFVIERGTVRPGFLGGAKVGVRRLLELLSNSGYELAELDAMLREGRLKTREAELEIWLGEVLGVIERSWPSLKRFNAVIPTGGGAAILDKHLTAALAAKGAAVYWPDEPVTANVTGLWKYGVKHVAR
jgi:hypothetical protein